MSSSCSAWAVIGVRLSRREMVRKEQVRACTHDAPASAKFCPECGKPVWKESWNWILDPTEDGPKPVLSAYAGKNAHPTIAIVPGTYRDDRTDYFVTLRRLLYGDPVLLSKKPAVDYQDDGLSVSVPIVPTDIGEACDALRTFLEPYGLWKPDRFGLWTVLCCG